MFCYDYNSCNDLQDFIADMNNSLFVPSAFMMAQERQLPLIAKDYSSYRIQSGCKKIAREVLFKDKNLEDILGLSKAWHSARYAVPAELKPLLKDGEWHALAEDFTASNGRHIVSRTNAAELKAETDALPGNCVGASSTYTDKCLRAQSHIFSITAVDGTPLSTIEFEIHDKNAIEENDIAIPDSTKCLHLVQHARDHNSEPHGDALQAFSEWKEAVSSGDIKINLSQLGETKASQIKRGSSGCSDIDYSAGYKITPEHLEQLFVHYRGTPENKGLRGVVFNPDTESFEDNRRNYMISGQYHIISANGKKTGKSITRGELTCDQWLEASGAKAKMLDIIQNYTPERNAGRAGQEI